MGISSEVPPLNGCLWLERASSKLFDEPMNLHLLISCLRAQMSAATYQLSICCYLSADESTFRPTQLILEYVGSWPWC